MYRLEGDSGIDMMTPMGSVAPMGGAGATAGGGGIMETRLGDENDPYQVQRQQALARIAAQRNSMLHPAATSPVPGAPGPGPAIDQAAFGMPGYDSYIQRLQANAASAAGRAAPGMAGPQMGALSTYAGAHLGPAGMASAAPVGSAQMAGDSAFRGDQAGAIDYQRGLMTGRNSVAGMAADRERDALFRQQRAMAAGATGSDRARAQRVAAQNMGMIGGDMAGRALEAQQAERSAAAGALGSLATAARGGDLSREQFNADAANTNSRLGAQLGTTVNLANQDATNKYGLAQAGFDQQAGLTAADAANQRQYQQAGFDADASRANLESQLRTMGLNDQQIAQMMQMEGSAMGQQQQGAVAGQRLAEDARQANQNDALQRYLQELRGKQGLQQISAQQPSTLERLGGAGMGLLQLAPEYLKLFGVGQGGGGSGGIGAGGWGDVIDGMGGGSDGGGGGGGLDWGGAASGAANGAAMGSTFGPWGTAVGGLIGGLGGLF